MIGWIALVGLSITAAQKGFKMEDEKEITAQIIKYRNTLLRKVEGRLFNKFINSPVEEFTEQQEGYEAGLNDAVAVVREFLIK